MDIRQLRYFVAICDCRNLSHAADHCHVAQSALSHHLTRMEDELGAQLFARKPRGMEPTAAGWRLYEHAQHILGSIDAAISDLRQDQSMLSGSIAVGMPYSVINVIGADLMKQVVSDYPRVKLLLQESLSGFGFRNLVSGEVNFALIYNPPNDERIERVALLEEELFCIGKPSIIGNSSDPLAFDELTAFPMVLLQSVVLSRALLDSPRLLNRLQDHASIQLASVAATLVALNAGLGCTLAPRVLVSEKIAAGELVARPVREPTPVRTLYLGYRRDEKPGFLDDAMRRLVVALVRNTVAAGHWASARLTEAGKAAGTL